MGFILTSLAALAAIVSLVQALPGESRSLETRQSTSRLVFSHFLIGVVSDRTSAADYDVDMQRAKAYGIDAFALNIATDSFTDKQLQYAYQAAANNGMKVFLSFDFNFWSTNQAVAVGQKIAQYANQPAQLIVDSKVFVSTFVGDGLDVTAVRNAAGLPIFFAPNFHPSYGTDLSPVDAALNWVGWPNNGRNLAPSPGANFTVEDGDSQYIAALGGKPYIAPVSPWFFTHYGPEVSYSKNWLFPSDLLWFYRWQELLQLRPRFVQIISWNDFGESHYVGPLSSPHTDDGASKWVNDMPHDAWLDMAKPFISAFKAGATSVANYITGDELIYWYRPQPMAVDCSATDTCEQPANNNNGEYFVGRPNGWQDVQDAVFVVTLLQSAATVQVNSGNNSQVFNAPAGASAFQVPMGVGTQSFSVKRGSQTVLSGMSLKDIINGCVCGLYNFNAYVGSLPAGFSGSLQPDGLASFTRGLKVTTCSATPSLGTHTATSSTVSPNGIPTSPTASSQPRTIGAQTSTVTITQTATATTILIQTSITTVTVTQTATATTTTTARTTITQTSA